MPEKKVMIIDDEKVFLEELKELLILCGYDTFAFSDGLNAFSFLRNINPDIILLDLKMKVIDGLQFADKLRHSSEGKNIIIIAMTGFNIDKQSSNLLASYGIERCLRKPFHILDLVANLESCDETARSSLAKGGFLTVSGKLRLNNGEKENFGGRR